MEMPERKNVLKKSQTERKKEQKHDRKSSTTGVVGNVLP